MFRYSIVIPVYNVEDYISECLKSLITQNKPMQIILVNDGSTDNSGGICDEFARKYDFIKVIHTGNAGPGKARNIGAREADGDFLMFVDSDDYISKDFFEKFETSDSDFGADIIFFEMFKVFENGATVSMAQGLQKDKLFKKEKRDAYEHISLCSKFPASPCGKLINLGFYKASGIKMPEDIISEDVDWSLELILGASSFDFFEDGFYYYRQRVRSRSSAGHENAVSDALFIIEKWDRKLKNNEYREYFYRFLAYQYAMIFPFAGALPPKKRKMYTEKMRKFRYLLNFGKTKKLKAIKWTVKLLGVRLSSRILYMYVRMNERKHA